ncbi:MAG TPA: alanine racemase, partial [Pirellulales bacterium]|nr:alanine racemase [Pirellulales bacterium]
MPKRPRYTSTEIANKLRHAGRVEDLFKDDLPTPALLVDLDAFESNVAKMAAHAKKHGKQLRPHAKTHKCVEVARRQKAAGAVGNCMATVPEAVMLAGGGIDGLLLTSPIVSDVKAAQFAELAKTAKNLMVAVDHARQIALWDGAAEAADVTLGVLVDLNVGDRRTGVEPGEPAATLAQEITRAKHLRLRGVQAYSGGSSHVVGFEARREHSKRAMEQAAETFDLLKHRGLPVEIFS